MITKFYIILLAILLVSIKSNAQFNGGISDGVSVGYYCQGISLPYTNIFRGGISDGISTDHYSQAIFIPCTNIFNGGISDGVSADCYSQAIFVPYTNIFNGGISDGISADCYSQTVFVPYTNIFNGGVSDGISADCYSQTVFVPYINIFNGGISDGFGYFYIGTNPDEVPLPIELLYFNAYVSNNKVLLEWKTATEINNDYFHIEKCENIDEWLFVAKVDGAGNSNIITTYSSVDNTPYFGNSYYRLKQVDFDGRYTYSQIKPININETLINEILIYPNPSNKSITIKSSNRELSNISIYNTLGQNITTQTKQLSKTEMQVIIDLSNLPTGIYYIKTLTTTNRISKY